MPDPNRSVTERGFITYDEFTDTYDATVTVRQSSAATRACVWVFTEGGGVKRNHGSAHLGVEQATRLRDALDVFIKEHSDG
jgi:hypothetical protein